MTDETPPVQQPSQSPVQARPAGDRRFLTPRMRLGLYFVAGVIFSLWFSLEILGAAGFVAFCIGMLTAQLIWRTRPKLNLAFAGGLASYVLVLAVWTVAFGAPSATKSNPTQTPSASVTSSDS